MMVYSSEQAKPYLTQKGIMNLRSAFAKDIFADDLHSIYEKQTEHRNALRAQSREVIAEIVYRINSGTYDNPVIENKLLELADRLSKTSGKKQYGYLKPDLKAIVNGIVSELAADERIASLYELWYEQKDEVIRTYTEELPERLPLVDNPEFKSIKNAVIQEALNISADRLIADEQDEQAEVDTETYEPGADEVEEQEYAPAPRSVQRSCMWQLYRNAKELLDRESDAYDPNTAVALLIEAAELGCGVAKYRLGKMFLRGEDVPKNIDYALRWLEESASEHNQYAEYLLGKTFLRGEDIDQDIPRAEQLLRRSSDQGNRYASYTLGKTLLDGELLLQDIPEAIRLLADSAEKDFRPESIRWESSSIVARLFRRTLPVRWITWNELPRRRIPLPHILSERSDSPKRRERMSSGRSVTLRLPRRMETTMRNTNSESSISMAKRSRRITKRPSPI